MISLIRVDDRLIHGQVQTVWIGATGAKNIMVIDDETKKDEIACQVLKFALPSGMKLKILSVDEAVEVWQKAIDSPNNIMVLFKSIKHVWTFHQKGGVFDSILVGPTCGKANTTEIVNGTYFTPEEIEAANALDKQGVDIAFQQTLDVKKVHWKNVRK